MRGPKTEAAIRKRVSEILTQHHAEEWITIEIKWDTVEKFKAITRGKPTPDNRRPGRDLPPHHEYQGEARRRVQDLQVPTQDREAACAAQVHARCSPDLAKEE